MTRDTGPKFLCGLSRGTRFGQQRPCHRPLLLRSGPGFGYNIENGVAWMNAYCPDHGCLKAPITLVEQSVKQGKPFIFMERGVWRMKRGSFNPTLPGMPFDNHPDDDGTAP